MTSARRVALVTALLLAGAGCGQTGPLVLPTETAPTSGAATRPASDSPAAGAEEDKEDGR